MVKNLTLSEIKYESGPITIATLPYINKATLSSIIGKEGEALNYWVKRLIKMGELLPLKNDLYVSNTFLFKIKDQPILLDSFREYLANIIRQPSYISLEYALAKSGIITDVPFAMTAITTKTPRTYTNTLGTFIYKNINQALFTGYTESHFLEKRYFIATPVKSLFDYLYLKNLGCSGIAEKLVDGLRINWDAFKKTDAEELQKYVELSGQKKMEKIMNIIIKRNLI